MSGSRDSANRDPGAIKFSMSGHQRPHRGASDDWLTPPHIIEALGPFDLDPCASVDQPWATAALQYTLPGDGYAEFWPKDFFVWLNPPFGPEAGRWLAKLAQHGNGIGLVAARTETRWFVEEVWDRADAILFLHGRPHFHHPDGTRAKANSGVPICLVGYGLTAIDRLKNCKLAGSFVSYWEPTKETAG